MLNLNEVVKALKRRDKGDSYTMLDILAICEGVINARAQKAILELRKAEQADTISAEVAIKIIEDEIIGGEK